MGISTSKIVPGMPGTIRRADYVRLIESLGFDLADLVSLHFGARSIEAVLDARDEQGRTYIDSARPDEIARHHIQIAVVDE